MKKTLSLLKQIKNIKDGFHLNSKYWQDWKKSLPALPLNLKEVAIGMILGDACMYKKSNEALIKFEQGYLQKELLFYLFDLFKLYCFMEKPGERLNLRGERAGLIKSYWFKTFSHFSFTEIWNLFYNEFGVKVIKTGLILNHLTPLGLAFWIMCDGSLDKNKKTLILHTQSFTKAENYLLSRELNQKFGFNSKVIEHKDKYWVIRFDIKDASLIHDLIKSHMIASMEYKLPEKSRD